MNSVYPAKALAHTASVLQNCKVPWVVGGSTGLALRGAQLEQSPRDIDLYADVNSVSVIHEQLLPYMLDPPTDNVTERYHSILSHYQVSDTLIELVGNFRVSVLDSFYQTEVDEFLYPYGDSITCGGFSIQVVPLGHELLFNLLRGRMDRIKLITQLMSKEPDKHIPLLEKLLQRNQFHSDYTQAALKLVQEDSSLNDKSKEELQ